MYSLNCFLLCFFISLNTYSQNVKFKKLTTSEGLSNNSVTDIVSDKSGGLWIATWDGLNFYDGTQFTIYKEELNKNQSIIGNRIIKLLKDKKDVIWVLTDRSVCRYLGNHKFKNYQFEVTPSNLFLSDVGTVIVKIKNLFYAYKAGKFYLNKDDQTATLNPDESFKSILYSKHPDVIINDVLRDTEGSIWYATRSSGLYIIPNTASNLNNNNIDHYTYDLYSPYSFNSDEIEKLFQDDFGNVWLGHKDGGLSMSYKGSEQITTVVPHPEKNPYLPNETIRAITLDPNNALWMGYYTHGLYYYSNSAKCYLKYPIVESKLNPDWDRVRSLFTSSDGSTWAGTYAGLIRIKNGKYILYEQGKFENFPSGRNYSIYEDHKKQLWISCWGGLAKFNLQTNAFESFIGQAKLNQVHIRKVTVYKNQVAIGTEDRGLMLLDLTTGKIKTIAVANGILGNSVYCLYKDTKTNYFWIATLGGVSVYDSEKNKIVKNITEKEGLPSHMVYSILLNNNSFWVSTTKGIASINRDTYKVTRFNPNEGWQGAEFSEGAYFQDKKGMLFFGGINGMNYFQPSAMRFNKVYPKLKISIDDDENYAPKIVKEYSKNSLKLNITPILFTDYSTNEVLYKLEGYDEDWKKLKSLATIQYKELPSGNYKLLVRNQGEKKSQADAIKLELTIKNPFYTTFWFYSILFVFVFVGVAYLIVQKNRNVLRYQKKLEKQIQERTQIINEQKNNLIFKNKELDNKNKEILIQKEKLLKIHHNLKNQDFEIDKFKTFMLSEFQEPISKIIRASSTLKKDTQEQLDLINQSGKLVNLISGWNYLDHIKDIGEIKKSAINLFPVLKHSIEKLKKDLQQNQVNFNCEIDNTIYYIEIDVLRLRLLIQYFFNDISKYSDSDSTVEIKIIYENNFLNIRVTSDSEIIKNNWENIVQYSPYFKAVQILLQDLKGEFSTNLNNKFQTTLQIPLEVIAPEIEMKETISWKHFNKQVKFSVDKQYFLVFSDSTSYSVANQVLESTNYELLFENSVANLNSVLKQINISALVFYQTTFSKELVHFLNLNIRTKTLKIPMIYIAEDINYELNEQLIELGIETLIQLPASASFITKKIASLMDRKKAVLEENKMQHKIFQILSEEEVMVTANDKLLKKALEIIKHELQDASFNVETLVEGLGISRIKCYRLFKESLQQSPSDIIMSLRLQKAAILLKTKKLNVSEVSFECGYNDPKYFGRSFKKYFGKSPKEYKQQLI